MQPATTEIETRSKAQALDWSLVLISQGIENALLRRESDAAWILEVAEDDRQRAQESIAAYEDENSIPWKKELPGSGLLFDVRAVAWFFLLALFYWSEGRWSGELISAGILNPPAVSAGEWWRFITAMTLHADIAHLAANISIGILFLGLAMGCLGAGNALLLSLLGGALGNVATFAVHAHEPFRSLGASGMVMASLGLITAHSLTFARNEKRTLLLGRGLMAGCLLVILLGFSPRSDVVAHVGGFVGGVLLGAVAMCCRKLLFRQGINIGSTFLFAAFLVGAWWLALK
jgi:membrane associated rhomboid family serine protease